MPIDVSKYPYLNPLSPELKTQAVQRAQLLVDNEGYDEEDALNVVLSLMQDEHKLSLEEINGAIETEANTGEEKIDSGSSPLAMGSDTDALNSSDPLEVTSEEDEENIAFQQVDTEEIATEEDEEEQETELEAENTDQQLNIESDNQNNLEDIIGSQKYALLILPEKNNFVLRETVTEIVEYEDTNREKVLRRGRALAKQRYTNLIVQTVDGETEFEENYTSYNPASEAGGSQMEEENYA